MRSPEGFEKESPTCVVDRSVTERRGYALSRSPSIWGFLSQTIGAWTSSETPPTCFGKGCGEFCRVL